MQLLCTSHILNDVPVLFDHTERLRMVGHNFGRDLGMKWHRFKRDLIIVHSKVASPITLAATMIQVRLPCQGTSCPTVTIKYRQWLQRQHKCAKETTRSYGLHMQMINMYQNKAEKTSTVASQ